VCLRVFVVIFVHYLGLFCRLLTTSSVMLLSSWVWKISYARKVIVEGHTWSGTEKVLDVGCGHGLMLIQAAKHLLPSHGYFHIMCIYLFEIFCLHPLLDDF